MFVPCTTQRDRTADGLMRRCPRLVAHVIAESLGYASPTLAARIVANGAAGRENWCEWILACYGGDARKAVQSAIRNRRSHRGYMAEFGRALALVRHSAENGDPTVFASWF
jgi:hypothetical protein